MRILLSDGSGLTARQTANRLHAAGHTVEVLSPDPLCLCRFTGHVRRVHRTPPYGQDPLGWLDAAVAAYERGGFDLLFPTQEQVAVLAALPSRLASAGMVTAVPPFTALAAVQDKVSAFATLTRLGIPQPQAAVGSAGWNRFPAFVKEPIGTASGGVIRVGSAAELQRVSGGGEGRLVQAAVEGRLAMCQSVWDHGTRTAFHANLRVAEGASGGASHKQGVDLPVAEAALDTLGTDLGWHGALSADVILTDDGPSFIDINPRLVEPENAWLDGVDLVGALLDAALGRPPRPQRAETPVAATHQLLLAVLGAAQQGRGRRGVVAELRAAHHHCGPYSGSREELTPLRRDPLAAVPVALAVAATLARPATWTWFTSGSVTNYALTAGAWDRIVAVAERP